MNDDPVASLATKLRTLDLEPSEAAALRTILLRVRNADPEVEGFGFDLASLGDPLGRRAARRFKGTDEELQFKGSDEELQALIDWLGEPRR